MKLKGPNGDFSRLVTKSGDNVAPRGGKDTKLESVNHENFQGEKKLPDTNPGTKEQSRPHFGADPGEKNKLTGFKPGAGMEVPIGGKISLNSGTRAFTYSKEGHAVDNGSSSEGQ